MTIRRSKTESATWTALAFAGGCLAGSVDLRALDVQSPAIVLMLVAFALTLPGRAAVSVVAGASTFGITVMGLIARGTFDGWNPIYLFVLVPAFIGASGGRLAGSLLDTASRRLVESSVESDARWMNRALSTRFILAITLVIIASIGLPSANAALRAINHAAASWLAIVWEIMSLLGWIGVTPLLLDERPAAWRATRGAGSGLTPIDVATHVLVVVVLTVIHAAIIVGLSAVLFIPITPNWHVLALTAFKIYLPLDLLAYITILTLGFASDVERQRRDSAQREAALHAESLDSRLAALRARLNPHFLFNALNSVHVLARSGKADETTRVVEGLTGLLRYVLDERRPTVPLSDELEFARQYLLVQQVRFGARLRYAIDSDVSLGDTLVPQLLLQPLVENAVEHGVANALDGGEVRIAATHEGDMLCLIVEDDGPGPSADSPAGIGLANTRERLARLFGDRARLSLERKLPGGGAHVRIELPFAAKQPDA